MASSNRSARSLIRHRSTLLPALVALVIVAGVACSSESSDSSGTGGSTAASGGSTASGGTAATGGSATGGTAASGGAPSTSGTGGRATGGMPPTGGVTGFGGVGIGGVTSMGGRTGVGGATNTGGATNMGGATNTGGVGGGATVTGGTASVGGAGGKGGGGSGGGGATGGKGGMGGSDVGGTTSTGGTGGAGGGYCPATPGTACNIMPVGDSITEGCCTAPMGGYRIELFHQALTNSKNITFVGTLTNGPTTVDNKPFPQHHEGHGGWKISQIAGVIDNAINSSKPHIVLLKIGTNDINGNDDVTNAPNRLESLINQITKAVPAALLVVSAIVPTTTDSKNPKMQAYNTAIKAKAEAAAAAGKHVLFVDNYKAFTDNANFKTALMADELHPNTAGYVVLGDSFYSVISRYLPAAQ